MKKDELRREMIYALAGAINPAQAGPPSPQCVLTIEDPVTIGNDVARASYSVGAIKEEFKLAYHALKAGLSEDRDPYHSVLGRIIRVTDHVVLHRVRVCQLVQRSEYRLSQSSINFNTHNSEGNTIILDDNNNIRSNGNSTSISKSNSNACRNSGGSSKLNGSSSPGRKSGGGANKRRINDSSREANSTTNSEAVVTPAGDNHSESGHLQQRQPQKTLKKVKGSREQSSENYLDEAEFDRIILGQPPHAGTQS
ncbi:PAP-associated domain-containing protein 5-like [Tropilaelaps mercedesae]|uniref:PAP-associated domain-containing protein 5-like n=1 Tax=Tropilaelaps mercedesae TaxID=418985 RepID=A0A1V9XY67_9ACAR|nr:PAP-associated domain-containing protein 5-like [Tropilaelaps mercedesae]